MWGLLQSKINRGGSGEEFRTDLFGTTECETRRVWHSPAQAKKKSGTRVMVPVIAKRRPKRRQGCQTRLLQSRKRPLCFKKAVMTWGRPCLGPPFFGGPSCACRLELLHYHSKSA